MKYIIVSWDDDKWVILHYSHCIDDVKKQYDRFKKTNPSCKLMIDYHEAVAKSAKSGILEAFTNFMKKV